MLDTTMTMNLSQPICDDAIGPTPPEEVTLTKWYVLHTRSRQEKAVAAHLSAKGITHFLPVLPLVRCYGRRKATVEMPLFPCYVFLHGLLEHAFEADRTKRVSRIIEVVDQERINWELRNLRVALERQVPLDPYPYLKKGLRVEVRSGPFRGLQGVIEDRSRPDRLLLQIDMLGRATGLEIDGSLLDPVE